MEWAAAPIPVFTVLGSPTEEIAFRDVTATREANGIRLTGTLAPSGLTASITFTTYGDDSVLLAEIEVVNETGAAIEVGSLSSLRLAVPRDASSRLGVLAGGRWDEAMPPRGYRLQAFDLHEIGRGQSFGAAEDGRSSGEHVPWFSLMSDDGGLLVALVWSGRWRLDAIRRDNANEVVLGIADFAHRLEPGEKLELPSVVMAGYAGDLDDGANAWRRWATDHWMPSTPENWPWIQYNHWYAYFGDIDATRLLEEARLAAELGCEVFVIDDGWFRGRRPDSYFAGWGDWVEDPAKFPDGIHAFGDEIRALGMRFGLWVEPERADDHGELVRQHPGWVATSGGEPIYRPGPRGNEGVHLCLGNPEVRRWMADEMIRVVREYGVDWLKWDYNLGYALGCDAADHGHQATDGHHAHTLGLYEVLDGLREACPELVIENCASGGHRVDLGTLRHTHTNWVSDYTHRAASCRQHAQGAGFVLPLAHLNTWALEDRDLTGFRSRMGGAFGVSSFMGRWTDEERATFRQAVSEYRQLRPYLDGDRYLLTGPWHGDWDIWQFVQPSGDAIALLAFRERGAVTQVRVTPRAIDPARHWVIQRASGSSSEIPGAELAGQGLDIHLPHNRDSEIIWLTAID
jgi:alpha-galactosidase